MKTLIAIIAFGISIGASAAPTQITKADIVATVKHMQELTAQQAKELAASREENAGVKQDLVASQEETAKVQGALDLERNLRARAENDRDEAIKEKEDERKAKLQMQAERDAERHHVSKIKTYLSIILAGFLILAVNQLPFGVLVPPMSIYARLGASAAAGALAWTIVVARFV